MSEPEDQQIPDAHRRTLPHVAINEQGMRELEIWIRGLIDRTGIFFQKRNLGRWLSIETTDRGPSGDGIKLLSSADTTISARGSLVESATLDLNVTSGRAFNLTSNSESDAMTLTSHAGMVLVDRNVANTIKTIVEGSVDGSAGDLSAIEADGGSGSHTVTLRMFDNKDVVIADAHDVVLFSVNDDTTTVHNLATGKTFKIKDNGGSALVTYTG